MGEEGELQMVTAAPPEPASSSAQDQPLLTKPKKAVRLAVEADGASGGSGEEANGAKCSSVNAPSVSFVEPEREPLNGPGGPDEPRSIAQGLFSAVSVVKKVSQRVSTKKQGKETFFSYANLGPEFTFSTFFRLRVASSAWATQSQYSESIKFCHLAFADSFLGVTFRVLIPSIEK